MKVITVWHRYDNPSQEYKFNHISDGYNSDTPNPIGKFPDQIKSWKGGQWKGYRAYLIKGVVVLEDDFQED